MPRSLRRLPPWWRSRSEQSPGREGLHRSGRLGRSHRGDAGRVGGLVALARRDRGPRDSAPSAPAQAPLLAQAARPAAAVEIKRDEGSGPEALSFAGDWKTTFGPVHMEQKGNEVTGQIVAFGLPLKGKLEGKALKVGLRRGPGPRRRDARARAVGAMPSKGTFQASNGNRGVWNGWRPDPAASTGSPADFSGLWLTDLGLMELKQDGTKVKGKYALRGTSSLEGDVSGRHLEFKIKAFRTGPGWFDLVENGTRLAGAGEPTACQPGTAGPAARLPNSSATPPWPRARSSRARPTTCSPTPSAPRQATSRTTARNGRWC